MEIHKPAGFGTRFLAGFLDSIIVSSVIGLVVYLIAGEMKLEWASSYPWQIATLIYSTITPVVWGGYVIGKRIFKIRIRKFKDDRPVNLVDMLLREVVGKYIVGGVTFGISIIVSAFMIMIREDKRAIHDFIGGTYVRYDEPA
ncbi:RDD family protein [Bacillus sp. B-jedd]|uniref:RDD family protein n=1 Tax=Bacillus sp. B-jedd TaxID=1476857 RepID=UPI00051572CA|nr:RDD family protein [Bacillus sp. B-jedd]CEG26151.1 integral inner membrane protein [Bacillus sp. B-jedd]